MLFHCVCSSFVFSSRRLISTRSIFEFCCPPTRFALLPFVAPQMPRYALSRFASDGGRFRRRKSSVEVSATRVGQRLSERRNYVNKGTKEQSNSRKYNEINFVCPRKISLELLWTLLIKKMQILTSCRNVTKKSIDNDLWFYDRLIFSATNYDFMISYINDLWYLSQHT